MSFAILSPPLIGFCVWTVANENESLHLFNTSFSIANSHARVGAAVSFCESENFFRLNRSCGPKLAALVFLCVTARTRKTVHPQCSCIGIVTCKPFNFFFIPLPYIFGSNMSRYKYYKFASMESTYFSFYRRQENVSHDGGIRR